MKSSAVPKHQPRSSGHSSADTRAMGNTSGDDVLVPADSKELSMLTGIEDADYFLQNEFVLRNGTNITETAPSYRLTSFEKWDTQTIERKFCGRKPYVVVCASMAEIGVTNAAVQRLAEALPDIGEIIVVLLEDIQDDPGVFPNRAPAIKDNTCVNPAVIQVADRPLTAAK